MRNSIARSKITSAGGAALLMGAALFLSSAGNAAASAGPTPPQAKSTTAAKAPAPTKKSTRTSKKKRPARPRAQRAPTPDRIREIQSALAQKGFYAGEPTGKWDARSVEAMKKFQTENGLTATGKLDAKSLQKLGLGSDVAGLAAPRPAAADTKPQPPKQ